MNYNKSKKDCQDCQESYQESNQDKDFWAILDEVKKEVDDDRVKKFQSAHSYVMGVYHPKKNIKPCIAYVLLNGLQDGWRVNSISIAYECLRVYDFDFEKAFRLGLLYLQNSNKKKDRTREHLRSAFNWVIRHKDFRLSCNELSKRIPCIGDKEKCYKIRGIRRCKVMDFNLIENQRNLYLTRLIDYGYIYKLSKGAVRTYIFLLTKKFMTGFDTLYLSYVDISKGTGYKSIRHIKDYLKELQKEGLIRVKRIGKKGINPKIATEIRILDLTGRVIDNSENLFRKAFS